MTTTLYGAIEAGGTKFNCAVLDAAQNTLCEQRISTTQPAETLTAVARFFGEAEQQFGRLHGMGVAAFGPVDLRQSSATYGCIQSTPKPGWSGASLLAPLRARLSCPIAVDTDVNAAAMAEAQWGAGQHCRSLVYVTVGTGIGGGAVMDGVTLKGRLHPEMGHISVRRHPADQQFAGVCPFHGDCLEGLASGPAIKARWGRSLDQFAAGHEAFDIIGSYLGQMAATIALMLSADRVLFGGGVMECGHLLAPIRRAAHSALNGYLPLTGYAGYMDDFIQAPGLAGRAGILGAFMLAQQAAANG